MNFHLPEPAFFSRQVLERAWISLLERFCNCLRFEVEAAPAGPGGVDALTTSPSLHISECAVYKINWKELITIVEWWNI